MMYVKSCTIEPVTIEIFSYLKKIESTNPRKNQKKSSISTYVNLMDDTTLNHQSTFLLLFVLHLVNSQ